MAEKFDNVLLMIDAVKHFNGKKIDCPYIYYRGQKRPWQLQSSIHRMGINTLIESENTIEFCRWLKNNEYISLESDKQWGDNAYYAIAQHYGYKTDFVDFTTSLEVASFFASDDEYSEDGDAKKYGSLWCLDQEDLKSMSEYIKVMILNKKIIDKAVIDTFEKNEYNPFFKFKLEGLSRVNNQSGVFLWDYNAMFSQYFGGPDYIFSHQKDARYSHETININFIYPQPNALEKEIERYIYPKRIREANKSEIFKKFSNNFVSIDFDTNDKQNQQFDKSLSVIDWNDSKWKTANNSFLPNSSINKYEELSISTNDIFIKGDIKNPCENYLNVYSESLKRNVITRFKFDNGEDIFTEAFNEIIDTLSLYPYNNHQIAESLYFTMLFLKTILSKIVERSKINIKKITWGSLPEFCHDLDIKNISRIVFNENEVIKLGFTDKLGISSFAYAPISLLNDVSKPYRVVQLNKLKTYLCSELGKSEELEWTEVMRYITNPRKLFEFEDILNIFTKAILPNQFVFRPTNGRIYIPNFVSVFGWD